LTRRGRPRLAQNQTCQICGEEFYKPRSHLAKWPGRTCSRSCPAVLRRRDRIERQCQVCGTSFAARADQVAKGFGRYCSNACNGKAQLNQIPVSCRWCQYPYSVPANVYYSTSRLFCGKDCRIAWQKRFGTKKGVNAFTDEQKKLWREDSCRRCGSTERLELDHIVPRFAGGEPTRENAQTLCRPCNRKKFWEEDLERYEAVALQVVAV
jgi:5-methylcytosine-specific restriction endonuclease McrA